MTFVSLILATLVIGGLLMYMRGQNPKSSRSSEFEAPPSQTQSGLDLDLVHQRWAEIQAMQTQGGAGLRNALLEADKLLDYIMQAKGFQGDTMGDRLKLNGDRFSDLNGIWTAHKLRNQIAHEVAIDIVKSQVEDAVRKLGRGIQDLGVTLS
ncbi:MAG: hypothetical protein U0526_01130 [Candidatus Saccharibacteria bacterium]|jgi:hypothetical protein